MKLNWLPALITRKKRNEILFQIEVLENKVKELEKRIYNGQFVFGIDFAQEGSDKTVETIYKKKLNKK